MLVKDVRDEDMRLLLKTMSAYGCGCKLRRTQLVELLEGAGLRHLVLSRMPIRISDNLTMLSTVDVITPLTEDPFLQGEITVAHVTNDLFALGIIEILGFHAILSIPPRAQIDIAVKALKGIAHACQTIGADLLGGHTIQIETPLFGGTAMGLGDPLKLISPSRAMENDMLILTKPLGIQMALTQAALSPDSVEKSIVEQAVKLARMTSKSVAELMSLGDIHAAVDIGGFGLVGHAIDLAMASHVDLIIETVPVLGGLVHSRDMYFADLAGQHGVPETSGGLLLAVDGTHVNSILHELNSHGFLPSVIGSVRHGQGAVKITQDAELLEVR